jgi:O-antigen ligase
MKPPVSAHPDKKLWILTWIVGVVLVILSGGATHPYSQVMLLLLTAGLLWMFPIRSLPGPALSLVLAATVGWVVVSTWVPLPFDTAANWLGARDPSLDLGSGVSAQPWLSMEKAVFFAVGLCWLLLIFQCPLDHYRRTRALEWLMWAIGGLAVLTVGFNVLGLQHPLTWGTHRFSFFPNHNQSGSVLAMGGILAMGFVVRSIRKRSWELTLHLLVFLVICVALFVGMSRSAVITMIGGAAIYTLLTLERKHIRFYVKVALPVGVMVFGGFLLYGSRLLGEFTSLLSTGGVKEEIRFNIWLDATRMASNFPLFGVGLGNFRTFFPFFMEHTVTNQAIHHPESDLLWVWTELGLVGLGLVLIGIVMLFLRLDPVDVVKSKGVRLIGFVAICMFLLAGFIEVSGHRLGTALLALVLYGLIQPETARTTPVPWLPVVSRGLAIGFVTLAGVWLYHMKEGEPFVSSEVFALASKDPSVLVERFGVEGTNERLSNWVARYPAVQVLHNSVGLVAVREGNAGAARAAFDRSHALNPVWWRPYLYHGIYIFPLDWETALDYWAVALELSGEQRHEAFRMILSRVPARQTPDLRELTYTNRRLQFQFFSALRSRPIEFTRELGMELAVNPSLAGFSSEQKQSLFWRFCEINGPEMMRRLIDRFPTIGTENWTVRAQLAALDNDLREASRLALMNLPEPQMIDLTRARSFIHIRSEYLLDSSDPLKVIALIQKMKADGNYQDMLVTLQVAKSKGVQHPYLEYQLPLALFHAERFGDAWELYNRMIRSSLQWD